MIDRQWNIPSEPVSHLWGLVDLELQVDWAWEGSEDTPRDSIHA
jgi:hypothetical protein